MKLKNRVIVNATALDRSGALSILSQFIENIPRNNIKWIIFIPETVSLTTYKNNVQLIAIKGVKPMLKRLWWDTFGLNNWLHHNHINPIASVSLQNTGFRIKKRIPSFIYYHQPLPFFPFKWNPIKKKERSLWFYKRIYPYVVKLFLKKDTRIFVQLDYIKQGFVKCFKHPENLITIVTPTVIIPNHEKIYLPNQFSKLQIVYPAMDHFYKNHRVISQALDYIDTDLEISFTIEKNTNYFRDTRIKCIGFQSYEKIFQMYETFDALVFPSYVETFGLPLLEAALTGIPIIAADLPYAREVLEGYEGVTFIEYNNPQAWAEAIGNLIKGKRYKPIDISRRVGWEKLFNLIQSTL